MGNKKSNAFVQKKQPQSEPDRRRPKKDNIEVQLSPLLNQRVWNGNAMELAVFWLACSGACMGMAVRANAGKASDPSLRFFDGNHTQTQADGAAELRYQR